LRLICVICGCYLVASLWGLVFWLSISTGLYSTPAGASLNAIVTRSTAHVNKACTSRLLLAVASVIRDQSHSSWASTSRSFLTTARSQNTQPRCRRFLYC